MKVERVVMGIGETKNIGNYETVRVFNQLEASLEPGDKISDVQKALRDMIVKLNERDFNALVGKTA